MSRYTGDKGSNIYMTPPDLLRKLGTFDLDPAYLPKGLQPFKTAERSFSEEEDGLKQPWEGRVWLNPPYCRDKGRTVHQWVQKLANHGNGILLITPGTETAYWQTHIFNRADGILFLKNRLQFYGINGNLLPRNQQGSCLVAYGYDNLISLRKSHIPGYVISRNGYWTENHLK